MYNVKKFIGILLVAAVLAISSEAYAHTKSAAFVRINGEEANINNSGNLRLDQGIGSFHDFDFANRVYQTDENNFPGHTRGGMSWAFPPYFASQPAN